MEVKALLVPLCLVIMCSAALTDSDLDQEWELYKTAYNKQYRNKNEDMYRRLIWEKNVKYIEHHNMAADRGEHTYWLGINSMADMTSYEFSEMLNIITMYRNRSDSEGSTFLPPDNVKIPSEIDWRTKGYVTPVKNQGKCGSCWAFSAVAALEGQHFRKTGKLVSLSEQNLMDCSFKEGNEGCNGGWPYKAYESVKRMNGIDTEEAYPYEGKDGQCRFTKSGVGALITGYTSITENDEKALQIGVATVGPISVCIYVDTSFQLYKRGVFDDPACKTYTTNHCVLAVGYGEDNGNAYWLVKNSWGTDWGMEGYIKMSRNKGNQCGIASSGTYPLM